MNKKARLDRELLNVVGRYIAPQIVHDKEIKKVLYQLINQMIESDRILVEAIIEEYPDIDSTSIKGIDFISKRILLKCHQNGNI